MRNVTKETLKRAFERESKKRTENQIIAAAKNLKLCKVTQCKDATNGINGKPKMRIKSNKHRIHNTKWQNLSRI